MLKFTNKVSNRYAVSYTVFKFGIQTNILKTQRENYITNTCSLIIRIEYVINKLYLPAKIFEHRRCFDESDNPQHLHSETE